MLISRRSTINSEDLKMKLKWKLNDLTGETDLARINHITAELVPGEKIEKALGYIDLEPAEGMFFNGYQTWTQTREYTKYDKMKGLNGMPEGVIRRYHLDGYGDYHFTGYPDKVGIFHGFSYCYFRNGSTYSFFGSLDEGPGYTIFGYNAKKNRLKLIRDSKGFMPQGEYHVFDLFFMGDAKTLFFIHHEQPEIFESHIFA